MQLSLLVPYWIAHPCSANWQIGLRDNVQLHAFTMRWEKILSTIIDSKGLELSVGGVRESTSFVFCQLWAFKVVGRRIKVLVSYVIYVHLNQWTCKYRAISHIFNLIESTINTSKIFVLEIPNRPLISSLPRLWPSDLNRWTILLAKIAHCE